MKSRHELKFFILPEVALEVRDFVREYLDFDEYSVGKPEFSYPVHTVHLDSDDWKLYWRTVQGDQDRWKLRVRYYSSHPDVPVFCEVKHQMADVIVKYRAGLKREALNLILAGQLPEAEHLVSKEPKQRDAMERFVRLMLEWNARPKLHILCMREAYESDDGKARVTLDRRLHVSDLSDGVLATEMTNPLIGVYHAVILQLRFSDRFPDWYRELVRVFDLGAWISWSHSRETISCAGLRLTPDDVIHNIVL